MYFDICERVLENRVLNTSRVFLALNIHPIQSLCIKKDYKLVLTNQFGKFLNIFRKSTKMNSF
uniref:Uncharacterized protein n=1 Tax=Meloidogyne enterolobii TaxID=390850 RepID=A0A6V7XSK5_MELEN|nr:unnamed protein product [Meloidogyne enterolobii]